MNETGATNTWSSMRIPHFVVAFEGPANWRTAPSWFEGWYKSKGLTSQEVMQQAPQCICVLGQYAVLLGVTTTHRRMGFVRSPRSGVPLLTFFLSLLQVLEGLTLSGFRLLDYEDIKDYFDLFVSTDSISRRKNTSKDFDD